MKSEKAKEMLNGRNFSYKIACQAVEVAEQELCNKFADDIHRIVHIGEVIELRAEIATLRTALDEANERCAIAQKVIADKNAKRGVASESKVTKSEITVSELTLNQYQEQAMTTCLPSSANDCYMLLMIAEEIGELCGKVSKAIRKKQIVINDNELYAIGSEDNDIKNQLKGELGDILWGVAGFSDVMKWTLEEVAQYNLDKLANRKNTGTIVTHTDH